MTEKPTLDALRELRALLEDPDHWTTGAAALDGDGNEVEPDDPEACQWCLRGGVYKVTWQNSATTWNVQNALAGRLPGLAGSPESIVDHRHLEGFNDRSSHADVLDLIDRTLRAYEAAS